MIWCMSLSALSGCWMENRLWGEGEVLGKGCSHSGSRSGGVLAQSHGGRRGEK